MIRGSCLCGDVAFEIEGEVTPIQLCHAERCRKATGGATAPELFTSRDRRSRTQRELQRWLRPS